MARQLMTLAAAVLLFSAVSAAKDTAPIWSIGTKDGSSSEFALAPDGYKDFIEHDFGYEDKFFIAGYSAAGKDFPYILPGPVDTWGGTWPTSGWRTHEVNILFSLKNAPDPEQEFTLNVDLADFGKTFLPLVKIKANGVAGKYQLEAEGHDLSKQRHPRQNEPVRDTLSLSCDRNDATPQRLSLNIKGSDLNKGGNTVTITVLEGSWIKFDCISLEGPSGNSVVKPSRIYII